MGKYFTVEVKPTMPTVAIGQHADFADGDIAFDWFGFDIPKGAAKLTGVVMEVRSAGDAGASVQKVAMDLLFARTRDNGNIAPPSLGAVNSPMSATTVGRYEIIGHVEMAATGYAASLDGTSICTSGRTPQDALGLVLQGEPETGTNVGYDKIYVAGILKTALDLESLTRINNGTLDGSVLTVNGTDPRLFLAVGDTIAATTATDTSASTAIGEVSALAELSITLKAATEVAVVNDDFIYNVNPIRFIFSFEK